MEYPLPKSERMRYETDDSAHCRNNIAALEHTAHSEDSEKEVIRRYQHVLGAWRVDMPRLDGALVFLLERFCMADVQHHKLHTLHASSRLCIGISKRQRLEKASD